MAGLETFEVGVPFFKMQGCGNDFVLFDNREVKTPREAMAEWAVAVCRRAFGVSADGVIFLEAAEPGSGFDYRWHFYNNDGSRAGMCGNGSRCAARLAWLIGLAPARHVIGTDVGGIEAKVEPDTGLVDVRLTPPRGLKTYIDLEVEGQAARLHFVDTGVPHAVVPVDDLERVEVRRLGRLIRRHPFFAPAGTNVNFLHVDGPGAISIRTYERGVEDETYACGTGAVASAVVAKSLGLCGPEVGVTTTGGESLHVRLDGDQTWLRGAAELVFRGDLYPSALGLNKP